MIVAYPATRIDREPALDVAIAESQTGDDYSIARRNNKDGKPCGPNGLTPLHRHHLVARVIVNDFDVARQQRQLCQQVNDMRPRAGQVECNRVVARHIIGARNGLRQGAISPRIWTGNNERGSAGRSGVQEKDDRHKSRPENQLRHID